ncbi:hypothetical protein EYF80_051449 [Liparis tanakae]|uniref:Uncharacterized protein n=1 Tax=Liparis tanakae TaxID=230148 RepID=A0A4Z2FC92_9TELE|nr:hypothetical protein EYF80_051449 [Liparis tanakae]
MKGSSGFYFNAAASEKRTTVPRLTFSTFSTVKSRASGVAAILPGVSMSPPARSCQTTGAKTHVQEPTDAVTLTDKNTRICNKIVSTAAVGFNELGSTTP